MNPLSTRPNRWRPITVFNLLLGMLFSLSAMAQPAFLKEGLVAYYPFNGNANDESGNGGNILNTFTASISSNRFGLEGSAYSFNGISQYICEEVPKLPLGNDSRSLTVWFKSFGIQNKVYLGYNRGVIAIWGNEEAGKPLFGLFLSDNYLYFESGSGQDPLEIPLENDSKWHMGVLTYDGAKVNMYLDGNVSRNVYASLDTKIICGLEIGMWSSLQFPFKGAIDDVRIYNRALSDGEVKALYDYESIPQSLNPRTATVTAQVVNGFMVGATITDGGYGYVSNPVVAIIGGGGTGAKATATQFNGVVTSITITNPGSGYTSAPTITISPPPFPPRKATSTAQVVNGFVVGTKITDGGFGYDSPPAVLIVGGGGSGAVAVASVANGVVTAITITNPGTGYTSAPLIRIASPPFAPKLGIETSKVFVRMSVVLGRKYQLEASTDLNSWTTTGPAFIAQDEELVQEFDVNQVGRYFRINQVP